MRNQYAIRTGAAFAAGALLVSGCAGAGTSASGSGSTDTLNIASRTIPLSFDPVSAIGASLPYYQAVYDTLIKREPDGSFSPMLATSWTWDPTRMQLSLTLRQGVTFSDGTPFDANAVKANLEHFKNTPGSNTRWLSDLSAVNVADATHVTLMLTHPDPGMLYYLSDAAGLMANPKKLATPDALKATPDGTGPYTLDTAKTVPGSKWVYDRKPGYWGTELPYRTVTMTVFNNSTAIMNGLQTGQLDTAVFTDADEAAAAENDPAITSTKENVEYAGMVLFDRNGTLAPALKDPRVRQAINYAIDRPTMLQTIQRGLGQVTSQIFGPNSPGYRPDLDTYYTYDPAKARQLLAEAGFPNGFDLKLPRPTSTVSDPMAAAIQTNLKAVGINVTWDQFDPNQTIQKIFTDRQYPAVVMPFTQFSNDWVMANLLVTPGPFNIFGSTDPTVQGLLANIPTETGDQEKADAQALNQYLVEQGWFVPFYRETDVLVTTRSVKAVPQDGMVVPSLYDYSPAK